LFRISQILTNGPFVHQNKGIFDVPDILEPEGLNDFYIPAPSILNFQRVNNLGEIIHILQ
jgi:hypothetical protein